MVESVLYDDGGDGLDPLEVGGHPGEPGRDVHLTGGQRPEAGDSDLFIEAGLGQEQQGPA